MNRTTITAAVKADFIETVEASIKEKGLFGPNQKILVAVSGGRDSMVLLRVLHGLAGGYGWKLCVAHYNHELRGPQSDADERFVRRTAKRLSIPFVAGRADVQAFARKQKVSVEMAARSLRHDFLARSARRRHIPTIALGHHADDKVELFFLRLLRGAGGQGLSGMRWSSASPADARSRIVRPLLGCSRKEGEAFARMHKVRFREDKTNAALDYLRNRLRLELLPSLLEHYQPALQRITLRLMEVLEAESDFVTQTAFGWLKDKETCFEDLPIAVQRRVLQIQLQEHGFTTEFERVEHLRVELGRPLTLRPGLVLLREVDGTVRVERVKKTVVPECQHITVKLRDRKRVAPFGRLRIRWSIAVNLDAKGWPRHNVRGWTARAGQESFDADKVGSTIALRHWQPGDRFQPIGMATTVKLQDLFVNLRVPRPERHRLVVGTTARGEVFWVEGLRISERFKLDESTTRRLDWRWERVQGKTLQAKSKDARVAAGYKNVRR